MNAGQWFNLSPIMTDVLFYGARNGFQGTVDTNRRTEDALINRGLITVDHNVTDKDGDLWLYPVLTQLGWEVILEMRGIMRPADDGRLTVGEALEEAYTPSGQVTCEHGYGLNDSCPNCELVECPCGGGHLVEQLPDRPVRVRKTTATVILFKPSGKYYTREEWKIPADAIGPSDMRRSPDFRTIGGGAVLVETQEPWGFPHLFPGVSA